jgi:hypothetical protein
LLAVLRFLVRPHGGNAGARALAGCGAGLKKSQESDGAEGQSSPRKAISHGGSHFRIRRDALVVVDRGDGVSFETTISNTNQN